jgi:hypothetical protein
VEQAQIVIGIRVQRHDIDRARSVAILSELAR